MIIWNNLWSFFIMNIFHRNCTLRHPITTAAVTCVRVCLKVNKSKSLRRSSATNNVIPPSPPKKHNINPKQLKTFRPSELRRPILTVCRFHRGVVLYFIFAVLTFDDLILPNFVATRVLHKRLHLYIRCFMPDKGRKMMWKYTVLFYSQTCQAIIIL